MRFSANFESAASWTVSQSMKSYTWGTPYPRHHITIDSYSMSVNPALHIALSHLRYSNEPRILWVDALCINQEDLKEREEQVTQMRLVYSCARRVLAWLGEEYESSDAAMSLLENIDMVDRKDFNTIVVALLQSAWLGMPSPPCYEDHGRAASGSSRKSLSEN
ncbi:heterokaryon incompatibility protein-domain-containing protein [Cadophora sp. MPI-SDFR-AT-0126]|nr:heterokaryon incompatibility protein-domain-containing protein [Leotiomycetes sp. MPI-SDFR-AT-0126]